MDDGVRLRRARPADAAALLELEQQFPGDRLSPRALRRLLTVPSARIRVAVAPGGAVVGALILLTRRNSGWARIYSVVVAPRARGSGLGQRLVAAAERDARAAGKTGLRLEVRVDNAAARALYGRLRYREIAPLPRYYEDGADGLRLAKSLA